MMRKISSNKHVIDFIFPIMLFFVFITTAVLVLLITADFYSNTTEDIQATDKSRTSLSYIATKIRQNDENGGISIKTIEGRDCLSISSNQDGVGTCTYIYQYEGTLRELFIMDGIDFSLSNGSPILEISSFTMEQLDGNMYKFETMDTNGNTNSIIVSERSENQ
ncbi:MAG: DUF4860 domain-containing protein [Suipraeoptans sp.]